MRKRKSTFTVTVLAMLLLCAAFLLAGCQNMETGALRRGADQDQTTEGTAQTSQETPAAETVAEASTEEAADEIDPETMDLIKYNIYVEMNNYMAELLENISNYYLVVEYADEFSFVADSPYEYKYGISYFNSDIIDDALAVSEMEPDFGTLDQLTAEIAEPMRSLMDSFDGIASSSDVAENQYAKAKEFHTVIQANAEAFAELAYQYMDEISALAEERIAKDEENMLAEGRVIIYNASHAITVAQKLLNECYAQGVYDDNITELDLTPIRPLYEELAATVAAYDEAVQDKNQLMAESLGETPMYGLLGSLVQSVEWMISQVESGVPIEEPGREYLGGIIHIEEVLDDCIDQYNTVFVDG